MFLRGGFVFFLIGHLFHYIRKGTHITFSKEKMDKENNKKLAEFLLQRQPKFLFRDKKKFSFKYKLGLCF